MRNIKLTIAYDGTGFRGWQIQKQGERTVQGEIKRHLEIICRHPVRLIGSGRTDTGVHARGQTANFHTSSPIPAGALREALNRALPCDIAVLKVQPVRDDFHARYSIKSKTYQYLVRNHPSRDPLSDRYALQVTGTLNVRLMRQAARYFLGIHDFRAFRSASRGDKGKDCGRAITRLTVARNAQWVTITISATGFLYKMARNITGTLIMAGKKEMDPAEIPVIMQGKNRAAVPKPAPAQGLCLLATHY
jgi:tRNA pseudouridine38-40 synthase